MLGLQYYENGIISPTFFGICMIPFFLTLPWKIKICTASKCSASEESLKEIGRNCLNLSRLLYGNSHCKPDISSVFCSQEFLGSPSIGMDRLTLAVCFVLSPPKQLRKSHSPLGKSECFKSL